MKELSKQKVIPTADLLSEMESVEIVGGLLDGGISGNNVLARCPKNGNCEGGNCNSGCSNSGNCSPGCGCSASQLNGHDCVLPYHP